MREGELAGQSRGREALVSHDNGRIWDTSRRYVLDEFEYYDGDKWFHGETGNLGSAALPDGRVLTVHGRCQTRGTCLIRRRP